MHNQLIFPTILTILDGWGHSENLKGNAIKLANTPTIDKILLKFPHSLLGASGKDVGLPQNQMGNSEVGHTTIGAGRVINQDLVRIQESIETKKFFDDETINNLCQTVKARKCKLHIIGLCSDGGVHSHINHLKAIIQIVKKYNNTTCIHIITDGRDTAPKIANNFIKEIALEIEKYKNMNICTISGRYYSMDRDCRWSRTEKTYKILTDDSTLINNKNIKSIIEQYYQNGISDEFIPPTRINIGQISDNDGILFFNFRPDRMKQLVQCFAKPKFKGFPVKKIKNLTFATFTEYEPNLKIPTVFPSKENKNFLGQIISNHNLKQLRLAETEKYAHVTYFFNGGIEEPFPGEDRQLVPSPKVETYDLKPEMSAHQITKCAISAIEKNIYKFIVINYANPDMIGHTGNLEATIKAIEVTDKCLSYLFNKIQDVKGTMIITADHGNADYMIDENGKPCKSHSTNLVPFILIENNSLKSSYLKAKGTLADIAPTILDILKIKTPKEMNGKSLINKSNIGSKKLNNKI